MAEDSIEHRIRVAIGKAFHHKHETGEASANLENIAGEHGVSEDQVKEQVAYLKKQNVLGGPLAAEGEQVANIPFGAYAAYALTDEGLAWAGAGYNYL